jgi:hypothetical protein
MFLLGVIGLGIFRWKEQDVFPSASIDLRIPKEEILRQAEDLAKKFGYQKSDVIKSISFGDDDEGKTFLEYELGNSAANELMRDTVPIFYWTSRFRKEFDQEKVDIDLSPTGKLTYFDFELPNDKALPSLSHDDAKKMALSFVKEKTGWPEEDLKLVEDETTTCPHRIDHSFTWEYQKLDWKGAKLWGKAQVSGNMMTTFNEFLHRPEEWDRKYNTIRSNNDLLYSIAEIFYVLIYIASLFIFFDALPKKNVRWKFALMLAGFCALLFAADQFNSLPDALSEYNSQTSYSSFLTQTILSILGQTPLVFVMALILGGTAEIIYRTTFGKKIALEKMFTFASLRSKETIEALLAGTAAFAISLGYQICYYWLGERFNYWCPLSLDNYQLLTSTFPSLNAFSLGFFASGSEEILYRVIMFALVQRFVGKFWLANLLQAAAWGFMHSNYPQQPAYARGIELTLEGMFNGWMLARFGLVACFVSHYLFDAFCTVLPLWSAPYFSQKLSAWLPLIPVLIVIATCVYMRKKKEEESLSLIAKEEESLANETIPIHEAKPHPKREITPFVYNALSHKWRYALALIAIIAPFIIHLAKPKTQIYTHPKPLQVSREQAVSTARQYLTDLHFDLTDYKSATAVANGMFQGSLEFQYIFEKEGFQKANALAEEIEHSYKWSVRFFKPLDPNEYEVVLDEAGNVISQAIIKDEDASGAKLTQAQALKIAEDFLKERRKVYSPLEFDNAKVENRKNRIDYNFTFKIPRFKVADADFIVTEEVIGDVPSSISHFWKIPDQWRWEREKQTKKDEICQPIRVTLSAVVLIAIIWWIISLFRHHFVKWRIPFMFGGAASILLCLQTINFLPGYFNMYKISMPMQTYIVVSAVAFLIGLFFFFAASMFGIAVAWGGIKSDWHKDRIEGALRLASPLGEENTFKTRRDLFIDAILFALAYGVALDAIGICTSIAKFHFGHTLQVNTDYQILGLMANCLWPSLSLISSSLESTLFVPLTVAVAFGLATKYRITTFWRYFLLCFVLFAVIGSYERYWQDYLIDLFSGLISSIAFWLFLTKGMDRNVLTILVLVWLASLLPTIKAIYNYGLTLFPLELAVGCALVLVPLTYVLYLHWRVWKMPAANGAQ